MDFGAIFDGFGSYLHGFWELFLMGLGMMLNGFLMGLGKGMGDGKGREREGEGTG